MITKYTYGQPFPTEATVKLIKSTDAEICYFTKNEKGEFCYKMSDEDIVYGLGEQIRGINKRGWKYNNWNYDNPHHHEDTHSLYGSHNFIIVSGQNTFGAFFDYPGEITFDIGYSRIDSMVIRPAEDNLDVYIITSDNFKNSVLDIIRQFRELIGPSYIPPLWAFGYGQSRWGYKDEKDIQEVADNYEKAKIPLDSIYLDIDYMDSYKDFTVDSSRFPDLKSFTGKMKKRGIHLVPIIDAGVKIEPGYDVYEEGVAGDYFCKDKNGNDFVGAVWPGKVHFPDFLNPSSRKWFGSKYKILTDMGIDGFWNDMNEPAIFYTEDRLEEVLNRIDDIRNKNIGISEYFAFTGMVAGLNGNYGDYEKLYHNPNGKSSSDSVQLADLSSKSKGLVNHKLVHNLYGMNMTRAAFEALCEIKPDEKTLFFSRSSYIGAHRYGGIWQGDNKSWWSHILQAMQQLPALNMAGFLYTGCDTGGFGCDTTEDLMIRWLQYSIFVPLFRNHSADGTRRQELYQFSTSDIMGEMVKIRYCLIPYLYKSFMNAADKNELLFTPMAIEFPGDEECLHIEDQLLVGSDLLITPVYKQNSVGRYVYLPEEMMLIRMRKYNDYDKEVLPKGHHYVSAKLNELVFFIRKGKSIPFGEPAMNTSLLNMNPHTFLGY